MNILLKNAFLDMSIPFQESDEVMLPSELSFEFQLLLHFI